ncbi:3'-5' exonuclease [Streptomyces mashuensis]|uniref:3'-5' exonuclease n=1 Tax=Streptomyces mashuensis TaxID=33904 RepID=A0A919ECV4_9ACTN|nr:exonuclease domain-containing protein [Streptomyces mashuensis]GHF42467.1 3'-5' exonuclease [Streptomyces mashuensis]
MSVTIWPDSRLVAFDTETTGTDWNSDRIVAAAVVEVGGGQDTKVTDWLINPGVVIPAQATAVHGITTERAQLEGRVAAEAIAEMTALLVALLVAGHPLVVFNARFDLTILDRECRRHDLVPLVDHLPGRELAPVIDPLVIDKQVQRYRRGSRKLPDLCAHWHVQHDGPHSPSADAVAAARLAWRLGRAYPRLGAMQPHTLHALQVERAAEQAASLQTYLRRTDPHAHVDAPWPYVPHDGAPEGTTR